MPAWFTVYCRRSVTDISASDIFKGISIADFSTIAESFGIEDDEAVANAVRALKIEAVSTPSGERFRLSYRPPGLRPVIIYVWPAPERVRAELQEAAERLDDAVGAGLDRIRLHLSGVTEVIALELGWSQMSDMGVVFASQVAEFLAGAADGLVVDDQNSWWAVEDCVPVQLAHRKTHDETGSVANTGR